MNATPHHLLPTEASEPWWRFPLVWMVIAGPALVVVAAFVTLWLALRSPDPVLDEDYYRKGLEINRTLQNRPMLPAVEGRNHTNTPKAALPSSRPGAPATEPSARQQMPQPTPQPALQPAGG